MGRCVSAVTNLGMYVPVEAVWEGLPYFEQVGAFGGGEEVFYVEDQGGAGVDVDGVSVGRAGVVGG